MKDILKKFSVLVLIVGLSACATSKPNLPPKSSSWEAKGPSVLVESYRMAVGDSVQINVWKNPELSIGEGIRPDGKISLPLVGEMMAVGLTPEELAINIENRLSDYIKAPNVTVILSGQGYAYLSRISVTGAVGRNISIPYNQGMTVLDAILEAGSVDLFADANNTKLHRRTKKGSITYDIYLQDILEDGDMLTNTYLLPGDVLTVPERSF